MKFDWIKMILVEKETSQVHLAEKTRKNFSMINAYCYNCVQLSLDSLQ